MALALYNEKMPWIYEEGIQLVNKAVASKPLNARIKLLKEFEMLLMTTSRNPFIDNFLIDNEDDFFLFKEIPWMLIKSFDKLLGLDPETES